MSITKENVMELIKNEKYIYTVVPSLGGAFDGARAIVAQDEATKPMRYLICDSCGRGYEGYLIKRTTQSSERVYLCKHCDSDNQRKALQDVLENQAQKILRDKLELIAEQVCNRVVDVLMIRLNIDEETRKKVRQAIIDIVGTIKI